MVIFNKFLILMFFTQNLINSAEWFHFLKPHCYCVHYLAIKTYIFKLKFKDTYNYLILNVLLKTDHSKNETHAIETLECLRS